MNKKKLTDFELAEILMFLVSNDSVHQYPEGYIGGTVVIWSPYALWYSWNFQELNKRKSKNTDQLLLVQFKILKSFNSSPTGHW